MEMKEVITAQGHPLVSATHTTTFEVTRATDLTCTGNCIIAVGADKGAIDLSRNFRRALREPGSVLTTCISWNTSSFPVTSYGHPDLILDHPHDLVWRRSSFIDGRTVGVRSDRTARTLPKDLITHLKNEGKVVITLTVSFEERGL